MRISNWKKALAASILMLAATAPALGDSDDDRRGGARWGMGHMMMGGHHWGMGGPMMGYGGGPMMGRYGPDFMLDRIDGRLAFMKAELKITEEQTPAWEEFARVVRDTGETHNDMMRSMMDEFESGDFLDKSLPERLTIQETHLSARLEQVKAVKAAVDTLYAMLNDEQKEVADDIMLPTMGMGMGRGWGYGLRRMRQ